MANFLSKLFSAGASTLVEAVGDAIDKNVTSDEERLSLDNEIKKASMNYDIEMEKLGIQKQESFLADVSSARGEQSRVQESENASWLAKNVQPVLSLVIIGLTFFLFFYVIFADDAQLKDDKKDIVIYILGALTTISTQVVAYFFGSSAGSAEKNKHLLSKALK